MKIVTRSLALLAVLTLFCSLADARPIRGTISIAGLQFAVDANGNPVAIFTNSEITVKGIKFPRSGIIINRAKVQGATNLSGRRIVFRNALTATGLQSVFDPETMNGFNQPITRNRIVFPKGRPKKMNLVTGRQLNVFNPNRTPLQNPNI